MKKPLFILILGVLPLAVSAGQDTDAYLSKSNPKLSAQEKKALNIAAEAPTITPAPGPDGTVRFVFGGARPSLVCAPIQVCDVELQPGEVPRDIRLGDSVRWEVTPTYSGEGSKSVVHLIIKPWDVGLETSLVVPTNRRTYRFKLRSHKSEYMAAVSFIYPEVVAANFEAASKEAAKERQQRTMPATGEQLDALSFDYTISGDAKWKPLRVYNDGTRTFIQMPPSVKQSDAPALMLLRKEGGLFTDEQLEEVVYRVHGDRYIVDQVFDRAVLMAGVGSSQERVTIVRGK